MNADAGNCGPLYELYVAARSGDEERVRSVWDEKTVERLAGDLLFVEDEQTEIDGPIAWLVSAILYGFGYLASFVLFFGASSRSEVVARLRWAYRRVGVEIQDVETRDGTERTTFQCPYRTLGADRYGERRVCHDVLDRVDDGYVTFLARHRNIDYDRPRACAGSSCCHSEVDAL